MNPLPDRAVPPRMADYESEYEGFRLEVPEVFNPTIDIVEAWAERAPEALALVSLDGAGEVVAEQTTADLARESRRAARALAAAGIGKGDRVFVMLPRVPAWYAAVLGAIRIGAVVAPAPNMLTPRDVGYRVGTLGAVAAITDLGGAERLDAAPEGTGSLRTKIAWTGGAADAPAGWEDLDGLLDAAGDGEAPAAPTRREDPMLIFFTSGTVSYPKMVQQPAAYGLGHVPTARFWHDLRPGDRHWTVSDTGWAKAAWGGLFGQWHEEATVVQVALGKPDADTILGIVSAADITSFCAPPTLYRLLVQADLGGHDLSRLRHCTSAGEPLNPEVIRAWEEGVGLTVYDGYGQSETVLMVANYRCLPVRPGSMGKPVPGWDVDVFGDGGEAAPDDVVGNVGVRLGGGRPVGLFDEYVGDEGANATAFRDGNYYSGDKAWRDGDGYLWFEGRDDDVITSAAYRIGPFEVESALVEHDSVVEAAVVGRADPERTQIVTAFVVLAAGREGSDDLAAELQTHTRELTAPYKYPREIHFVAELPKTISGKIRRSQLREELAAGTFD
ncbi:MAG TPA: AMP-binding protein [Solirubrobacterales bacterium]|nr:AMP-binding protein [Solirubrobacterales bacterium]